LGEEKGGGGKAELGQKRKGNTYDNSGGGGGRYMRGRGGWPYFFVFLRGRGEPYKGENNCPSFKREKLKKLGGGKILKLERPPGGLYT